MAFSLLQLCYWELKSDDEETSETESPKAEIKAEDTKEEKSDRIDDADIDIMVE